MNKTVYVVGGDRLVVQMFTDLGWSVNDFYQDHQINLVCFTGGADIQPHLYGEDNTGLSHCSPERDKREIQVYESCVGSIPMVGICRGGQLLNVMNGGKLIQDIGHQYGIAKCHNDDDGEFYVQVCHHQGIVPPSGGRESGCVSILTREINRGVYDYASWFPKTKSLCFQPHPEWGHPGTRELFFDLIGEYIG